jgi:iron complex outermembrane receptor protein
MHTRFLAGAALLACTVPLRAEPLRSLPPLTVTANPLATADLVAPTTTLQGAGLTLRARSTLGETLDGLPGVSATAFGPGASRPVIRGLDGDRIRILANGGAAADLSSLSYDHAVPVDPLAVDRIEVLRGPGALLYGGTALGGVVNVIDNRIPREPLKGFTGKFEANHATGARESGLGLMLEGGNDRVGLHVDMHRRRASSPRVPLVLPCTQGGITSQGARLCNADADADGAAIGASVFFDHGYLGASASDDTRDYGSAAEDEVRIAMRSRRQAVRGEWRQLPGFIRQVTAQASTTRYRHTEFDAGAAGTVFSNRAQEMRIDARHAPVSGWEGVMGAQLERNQFAADGAEAFAPYSRTRSSALFLYEERQAAFGKWTLGARTEDVRIVSDGNPLVARFTPAQRRFRPASLAAGALWNVSPAWQATAHAARSERAPRDYELFADGPHVASGAYEVGNANLPKERALQFDLGLRWSRAADWVRGGVYASRFRNYAALLRTGLQRDADGNGAGTGVTDCGDGTSVESGCAAEVLPELAYRNVQASFRGFELEGNWRLADRAGTTVDLQWRADAVRGTNRSTSGPLPRLAPWRAGATLVAARGRWTASAGFDHHGRQLRVPAGDLPTPGYTFWNAAATYRMPGQGGVEWLWFARLDNATDRLAYAATSLLTQTAPGRVPLPGRSLRAGVQATF